MNFVISSTALLNRLQLASKVVNSKNTLPILDNFLIKVEDDELKITASDLETTLTTSIKPDSVDGNAIVAIDSKKILEILKEFPEQPLTFQIDTESLKVDIKSENGKFSLVGQSGEDFPKTPELKQDQVNRIDVEPEILFTGITSSIFATADDELRPIMNGVLIEISPDNMTFVASDSHKLVRYRRKDATADMEASFVLPKKPAGILKNIVTKAEDKLTLEFDDKNAIFSFMGFSMVCRLIEGNYPSYNSVIPTENPYKMVVDRVEFYNTLKRVSIFSNQASNLVKLNISGNRLNISAQDIDYSISAKEDIPCQYEGEEMTIGFKSLFLLEILTNLSTEEVCLEVSDPTRAGLILPKDNDNPDEEILMLLMPMMINN
ncbi:MAG: DNA polymerase III subunit beta [Candidatus Delongbacteria bacterium]|nr:DNA polymerase III subunit beta [Candidatus Delongbacteria bacterium]